MTKNEERARELLRDIGSYEDDVRIAEVAVVLDEAEKRGAILYDGCKELLDMANTTIAELYAKLDQEKVKPHIVIDALQRENAELKAEAQLAVKDKEIEELRSLLADLQHENVRLRTYAASRTTGR